MDEEAATVSLRSTPLSSAGMILFLSLFHAAQVASSPVHYAVPDFSGGGLYGSTSRRGIFWTAANRTAEVNRFCGTTSLQVDQTTSGREDEVWEEPREEPVVCRTLVSAFMESSEGWNMSGIFYVGEDESALALAPWPGGYAMACLEATHRPGRFDEFKQDPRFTTILEHGSKEEGAAYLHLIRRSKAAWMLAPRLLEAYKENDSLGGAEVHDYGENVGHISVSTLRYIHDAAALYLAFGPLDGWRVAEIGGGYGGLAKVLTDTWHLHSHTIFDIPAAVGLVRRYMKAVSPRSPVIARSGASLAHERREGETGATGADGRDDHGYDLVVSNFAVSELSDEVQAMYAHKLLLPAKRAFLTLNSPSKEIHRILGASNAHQLVTRDAEPYLAQPRSTAKKRPGGENTVEGGQQARGKGDRDEGEAAPTERRRLWHGGAGGYKGIGNTDGVRVRVLLAQREDVGGVAGGVVGGVASLF